LVDAPAKPALGSLDVSKRATKVTTQRGDVVGAAVGETSFGVGPDGFVGVELRGVGRKAFEMQPREATADFPNRFSFVNAGVVPDQDDVPAEVAQQVPEEFADLVVPNVLRVALEVQADVPTPGSQGDARDHGDAIMPVAMMNDGRLAARSPGLSHRGDQEEARLVDEDDVGTQPRSVFFTRGQFLRFQRSMTSSSRSSARRSGFW
jgi:hypothetical protein